MQKDSQYWKQYRQEKAEVLKMQRRARAAQQAPTVTKLEEGVVWKLSDKQLARPVEPKEPRAYSKPLPAIVWQSKYGCTGCNLKPAAWVDSNEYQGVVHNVYLCKTHLDIHIEYLEHGAAKLLERQAAARLAAAGARG